MWLLKTVKVTQSCTPINGRSSLHTQKYVYKQFSKVGVAFIMKENSWIARKRVSSYVNCIKSHHKLDHKDSLFTDFTITDITGTLGLKICIFAEIESCTFYLLHIWYFKCESQYTGLWIMEILAYSIWKTGFVTNNTVSKPLLLLLLKFDEY